MHASQGPQKHMKYYVFLPGSEQKHVKTRGAEPWKLQKHVKCMVFELGRHGLDIRCSLLISFPLLLQRTGNIVAAAGGPEGAAPPAG